MIPADNVSSQNPVCRELLGCPQSRVEGFKRHTDLTRFDRLHPEGVRLIRGWFKRAWSKRDCKPEDSFEPFIFAWIAFNGWAVCVTDRERDREYIDALIINDHLSDSFNELLSNRTSPFAENAEQFRKLLPIFKAQDIRRHRIILPSEGQRPELIQKYLDAGLTHYEPQCAVRHGQSIPLDWAHTLPALYQVRCNLFHGEKRAHSEMDQAIVWNAYLVLIHFFDYLINGD